MILGIYYMIVAVVGWVGDYWIGSYVKGVPWEPLFAIGWMAGALLYVGASQINYALL